MQPRVIPLLLAGALGAAAQAQPARGIPVAPGIYAQAEEGCARATYVNFYQDNSWGNLSLGTPDYPGASNIFPIRRVAPGRNGFTNIWWDDDTSVNGNLTLKPTAGGGFVQRSVSYGSGHVGGRVDVSDTAYVRCAFDRLSPRMQAAIRRHRPQLAPGASGVASVSAPVSAVVPPFNIRPGHYLPVQAPCASPSEMIFFYDGRRFGWIDMSPFNPARMDPVAGARRTATGWWQHGGERVRVLAPDRIATSDPDTGDETLRWCPANEVRASARPR